MPDPFWTYTTEGQNSSMNKTENFDNTGDWNNLWSGVSDWWSNSALNPGTWQKKIQSAIGINSAGSQGKLAYTDSGIPYDESNIDSKINALAQEYAYKRDDSAYQRLFADLKAAGVNPAVLMSSAGAFGSDAAYRSNYNMTTKDQVNSALKVGTILALLLRLMK